MTSSDPTSAQTFLLQRLQPAMTGLIDGSLSTLAPIFAVALATATFFSNGGLLTAWTLEGLTLIGLAVWTRRRRYQAAGIAYFAITAVHLFSFETPLRHLFTERAHPAQNIGALRSAGFSVEMTAHAYALIDSYVYGFALSEHALPIHGPDSVADVAESMMQQFFSAEAYPHLVEFTTEHIMRPGYDFGNEFEFGLSLILDALARSIPDRPHGTGFNARMDTCPPG